jgi:hypothetical protein
MFESSTQFLYSIIAETGIIGFLFLFSALIYVCIQL